MTPAKGAITRDLREGGRVYPARTRYRRLAIASGHSILRVIPDGGRTHQIRRHLAAIGHPVIGDERYGHLPTNRYFEEKHGLDRSFLHLVRIEIAHPRTGARLLIESTLPGDLRSALERATGGSVLRFLEQKHALGDQRDLLDPAPPRRRRGAGQLPRQLDAARRRLRRAAALRTCRVTSPRARGARARSCRRSRCGASTRCGCPSRSGSRWRCRSWTSRRGPSGTRSCRTTRTRSHPAERPRNTRERSAT